MALLSTDGGTEKNLHGLPEYLNHTHNSLDYFFRALNVVLSWASSTSDDLENNKKKNSSEKTAEMTEL